MIRVVAGLLCVFLLAAAAPAGSESSRRLVVEYRAPYLSVEAHGVELWQVVKEIATKVGFEVVELRPSATLVTVSIRNRPLPEALRQILRMDDHAFLYRGDTDTSAGSRIERIVLWGQRTAAPAVARAEPLPTPAPPEIAIAPAPVESPRIGRSPDGPGMPAVASRPDRSSRPQPAGAPSGSEGQPPSGLAQASSASDLLARHALSAGGGLPTTSEDAKAGATAPGVAGDRAAPTSNADLEASLAETTQAAQRDIRTLVEALTRATRSMGQTAPAAKR